jgi:ABC-type multidrug transport system, ATPase and permease components
MKTQAPFFRPEPPERRNDGRPLPRGPLTVVQRPGEDPEDAAQRPLEWGLIRRLFGYTKPFAWQRNWLVFLTLARSAQLAGLTWLFSSAIAGPVARGDRAGLWWTALGYGLLALVSESMFHFRMRYAQELGERVVHRLRGELFASVQRQPMAFFHKTKLGRVLGRMTSDIEALRVGIQDVFFVSIVQGGQMLGAAVVMLWTDWPMFLVVLGLAPVIWKVNLHFRDRLSRFSRASHESFSRVTATLAESVNGIRVTQGFVREATNAGLFRRLLADHSRHNMNLARASATLNPILELNNQFFIAALLLLGGWRVLHGGMDIGALITFFFFANFFFAPITVLGNLYNHALVAMAGAERVFKLIDREPEWVDAPDAVDLPDPRREQGAWSGEQGTTSKEPGAESQTAPGSTLPAPGSRLTGVDLEFRNVTFAYEPDTPVLRDVSFRAAPGQTIALVGHTGSGKSSIINLATKFYLPDAGEILIDGREIRSITGRSLHRQLGIVTQQNFLFTGTVLDNIRFARPEATEAEVRAALAALGCPELPEQLPDGLATEVGERGGGLSLGQRQLVCFARAWLADPRLVILDEATSAIDSLTEARLQEALVRLLRGRTSLVVAHRLSTIRAADLILVLDRGVVVERGTHDELLARGGAYARLHAQFASGGTADA